MKWPDDFLDKVICGDCIDVMADMPDSCVDMVLCDLPYGLTQNKWDSAINLQELWPLYWHILRSKGLVVLTSQQPFTTTLINSQPLRFRYDLVWNKVRTSGFLNANRQPLRSHETILVFYRRAGTYNPQLTKGEPTHKRGNTLTAKITTNYGKHEHTPTREDSDMKYPKSIIEFIKPHPAVHPTQKPVELFAYLIKTYSNPGDLVLDNCIGSGTTAVAATRTGRHFVGIDIEEKYCEIAGSRRKHECQQLTMKL